jgi:hypothetical protein
LALFKNTLMPMDWQAIGRVTLPRLMENTSALSGTDEHEALTRYHHHQGDNVNPKNAAFRTGIDPMLTMLRVTLAISAIMMTGACSLFTAGDTSEIAYTVPVQSSYSIVATGQAKSYNATVEIAAPTVGQAFYGQDAQFSSAQASYTKSSDGLTVNDVVTGLTWQQGYEEYKSWSEAKAVPGALNAEGYGGYTDWRLPTIKELYSIWIGGTGFPFVDLGYFAHPKASPNSIFWSGTKYSGRLESSMDPGTGAELAFGVNFDHGHIKAYSINVGPTHFVRCVRGDMYGVNNFRNNNDGTITDQATGLMWAQADSGSGMDWEQALAFAQSQNAANYLGHDDWRLPNNKELQNIVDYARSPGASDTAKVGPAIDPLFSCTGITNEAALADYPWYWTSTTVFPDPGRDDGYRFAWYVAFGRAVDAVGADLHGAGAVRFAPKTIDIGRTPIDSEPGLNSAQSIARDADRVLNYVRLVRNAN